MSEQTHRAWRFAHPDQAAPGQQAGLQLSARGEIDVVEGADAIRQAIRLLLSTIPGERVMRPDYGCDLFRRLFVRRSARTSG